MSDSEKLKISGKTPPVEASTGSPNRKLEPSSRSTADNYNLSKSEIDSLRREFQKSGQWMREQLKIDPELKHL